MKIKYALFLLLWMPLSAFADITEQEIIAVLGEDYHTEAAQALINKLQPGASFPTHAEFTYNFYDQGVSLRITDGKWIQGVRIYNKTLLFQAAQGQLPYELDFSKTTSFTATTKAIGRAPAIKDNTRGLLYLFPNELPEVKYLIELAATPENEVMSIAWLVPDNRMEQLIIEGTPPLEGLENHSVVQDLLGGIQGDEAYKKVIDHPELKTTEVNTGITLFRASIGLAMKMSTERNAANERMQRIDYVGFNRRKSKGAQRSFPAALPTGLFWWSTLEEVLKKGFLITKEAPSMGYYVVEKTKGEWVSRIYFKNNLLTEVIYEMKEQ